MKFENLVKYSIIIGFINSVLALTLEKKEYIDDHYDMYTKECRAVTTANLEIINDCLKYLSEPTIKESELDSLCESFKDYYAKDNDTETDTETETETEEENDSNTIVISPEEIIPGNANDDKGNISILQLSDLTEEERETAEKIFNNIIGDDYNQLQDFKKYKRDSYKKKRNFCKVYVKRWNYECRNISRIAPTINAALENYYFRRQSFCLKNSENRYCTIVMNEIKSKAFNGTDKVVNPLNEMQTNSTCECYKRKMDYLKKEYYSSKDPEVEKTKKNYSKSRKMEERMPIRKRNWQPDHEDGEEEDWKEYTELKDRSPSQGKLWKFLENFVATYIPRIGYGVYHQPKYILPSYREFMMEKEDDQLSQNKEEKKVEEEEEEEEELYNQEFLREINRLLNPTRFEKRMVNEMNINELKKQIIKYQGEMDQLLDTSVCNATFTYTPAKSIVSSSHPKRFLTETVLFIIFLEVLLELIL